MKEIFNKIFQPRLVAAREELEIVQRSLAVSERLKKKNKEEKLKLKRMIGEDDHYCMSQVKILYKMEKGMEKAMWGGEFRPAEEPEELYTTTSSTPPAYYDIKKQIENNPEAFLIFLEKEKVAAEKEYERLKKIYLSHSEDYQDSSLGDIQENLFESYGDKNLAIKDYIDAIKKIEQYKDQENKILKRGKYGEKK